MSPFSIADTIVAQLLFLESEDPTKDVQLYINSPGGSVSAGMAIYDTMQYIKCDVSTICIGQAASMGAFLLAAGEKGKRFSLPNSRVMIHQVQVYGGLEGAKTDVEIQAKEMMRMNQQVIDILAKHTGQPIKKVQQDSERDYFMTSDEAKKYGIIDKIIQ